MAYTRKQLKKKSIDELKQIHSTFPYAGTQCVKESALLDEILMFQKMDWSVNDEDEMFARRNFR